MSEGEGGRTGRRRRRSGYRTKNKNPTRQCGGKKHFTFGPLFEIAMSKKCVPLWCETHFEVKSVKTDSLGPFLEVEMSRRCGAKRISKSKLEKTEGFGRSDIVLRGRHKGFCAWPKVSKTSAKREGFVAFSKALAGVGHLKGIRKDAVSVTGAVQETCSSEMFGGQGADFLRGVAFWSMRSSSLLR